MAQTTETLPLDKPRRAAESPADVVDHFFALSHDGQLGALRSIAPKVLARLTAEELRGYMVNLSEEVARAARGEPTYDVRPKRQAAKSAAGARRVAVLVDELFEDSEFREPYDRLREAGHLVTVVGVTNGKRLHGKKGREAIMTEVSAADVRVDEMDALVIPGGYSPDHLRVVPEVVRLVRDFFLAHKPVAAICHGPSLLVEADVVRGRTVTSWPSIRTDLVNAGAIWVDKQVVVEGNLITSRKPADVAAFCDALLRALSSPSEAQASPERLPESAAPIPEAMSAAPARL